MVSVSTTKKWFQYQLVSFFVAMKGTEMWEHDKIIDFC